MHLQICVLHLKFVQKSAVTLHATVTVMAM